MRAVDLIRKKRDGGALTAEEVQWLIQRYTAGEVGDDQMAAFAMAVFFRGMAPEERSALVAAMMASGDVMDLTSVPGVKVDKHSTGGVGDKVSICLAPLVAARGVPVPMISGRGLGHTGGTLDKLEAIPGFRVDLSAADFEAAVRDLGIALIGQTERLVPADKRLYALRDVTATVESIPMIAASIMSKKLAEGIDALVLDVKTGSGAFMKRFEDARELAQTLIAVGEGMGKRVRALVTDMNQVLGRAVGNANETWEAVEVLKGGGPDDLVHLTVELGAEMLVLGKVASDLADGRAQIHSAIADGSGFAKLQACVARQGGDPTSVERRAGLPMAPHRGEATFAASGYVSRIDTEAVGRAGMLLGAGRARSSDIIDPAVGFEFLPRLGDEVRAGQVLALVDHRGSGDLELVQDVLRKAVELSDEAPEVPTLILERLGAAEVK
ncbi:MAG: thymidine phosphorylase [Myxococcales bacterium]|nr:thymidine phosphorylase [Myxococcales bacterium]MCB9645500.1 thymidine phosphorylase [Deltaproteobacteria bacterium]